MLYPLNIKRQMDPSWCHLHSSLQPRQYSPMWLSGIWILLCRSSTILRGIGILLCLDGMWILLCRWSKILCLWTFWFYLARHGKEQRLTVIFSWLCRPSKELARLKIAGLKFEFYRGVHQKDFWNLNITVPSMGKESALAGIRIFCIVEKDGAKLLKLKWLWAVYCHKLWIQPINTYSGTVSYLELLICRVGNALKSPMRRIDLQGWTRHL